MKTGPTKRACYLPIFPNLLLLSTIYLRICIVPVLFWIYGGGYTSGSKTVVGSSDGIVARAKGGIIFVALNYRLGLYVSVNF